MSENRTESVPVLIVGGGGAGLTMSTALSLRGIPSILINMRPGTSVLPKAHVLNQRTMEIFTELGVAEEIYARTCPPENMRYTGWYAGLNGDREHFGRQLGKLEAWGGGYSDPDYIAASPCATSNLPQIRLEPLLLARAEEVGSDGSVRFNHELTALEVREDGVSATIADHNDGSAYTIEAKYLIAADGGRTVGRMLGIGMTGPTDLQKMISIHMTADLKPWLPDDEVLIRWFVNPDFGGSWSGVLVAMGPDHWGGSSEEWVFHMQYATDDPDAMQEERVLERMRATLGLSDHQFEVHKISSWVLEGSSRMSSAAVLSSSSAMPPTGTRRPAGSASTPPCMTPTTCSGSSPPCSADRRRRRCSTPMRPNVVPSTSTTSTTLCAMR